MKLHYLFPYRFKIPALIVLIPMALFGVYMVNVGLEPSFLDVTMPIFFNNPIFSEREFFSWEEVNILNEIVGCALILASLVVAFSREQDEDEYITQIRLDSLAWAVYANYFILFSSMILLYGFAFFWMMILNMFTTLWFFIIRFNWKTHQMRKALRHEA